MTDTTDTTKARRGRKPTGQALTNAERQARHKAKLAARAAEAERLAAELARVTHERDALKAEAALVTTRPLVTEPHPEARALEMLREELKALNARVVEIKRRARDDHEALMTEIRARDAHITDLRNIIEQKDKALDFLQARLDALAPAIPDTAVDAIGDAFELPAPATMTTPAIIAELRQGIPSDKAIADRIGLDRSRIARFRTGKAEPKPETRADLERLLIEHRTRPAPPDT
ncbi:MAG: hypothetical protein JXM75_10905 [Chromatiaceae bacterium]|nr:hypothetical protein [Chromatiaceae bacterium]